MTLEKLDAIAAECSDHEAAQNLNEVRAKLFQLLNKSQPIAAWITNHIPPSLRLMSGLENTSHEKFSAHKWHNHRTLNSEFKKPDQSKTWFLNAY